MPKTNTDVEDHTLIPVYHVHKPVLLHKWQKGQSYSTLLKVTIFIEQIAYSSNCCQGLNNLSSFIFSLSISHILEDEFFCLGSLGSSVMKKYF